jgi:hypothetical protein
MLRIVDLVEKEFEEKNEGKKLPDFQKNKAREMERELENFLTAVRHFSELGKDVDIADIKKEIQSEVDSALR